MATLALAPAGCGAASGCSCSFDACRVGSGTGRLSARQQVSALPPRRAGLALRRPAAGVRLAVYAGNAHTSGPFSPLVNVAKTVMGQKELNLLRGKAISAHSQVITEFCKSLGADAKQRQGLIRLAKKTGEKLGFLA